MLALIASVLAEPPVPSSQYLPSNQYGAPSFGGGHTDAILRPNTQYGAPSRPSSSYGAPGGGYDDGPSVNDLKYISDLRLNLTSE